MWGEVAEELPREIACLACGLRYEIRGQQVVELGDDVLAGGIIANEVISATLGAAN